MAQRVSYAGLRKPAVSSHLNIVPPVEGISESEREFAARLIMNDSIYSQTLFTLTTGVFITGLALHFHAPNFVLGFLAASPFLTQLFQVLGIPLVEKYRNRRKITVWATAMSRFFVLPMALTPYLPNSNIALIVLAVSFFCHGAIGAIATCAWNSWVRDILKTEDLGTFFSKKLALSSLMTMVATLAGGYGLKTWASLFPAQSAFGFTCLLLVGLLIGVWGIFPLTKMPEIPAPLLRPATQPLLQQLKEPIHHTNYKAFMQYLTGWNLATFLASPLFTVYLLTTAKFSVEAVTTLSLMTQITCFLSMGFWGKLANRDSNKMLLLICSPLFLACMLAWSLVSIPHSGLATFPLVACIQIIIGIASGGLNLANGNLPFKLAPEGKGTSFLATNSFIASLAAGLSPIVGGFLSDWLKHWHMTLNAETFGLGGLLNDQPLLVDFWPIFFGITVVLGILSVAQLRKLDEAGHVSTRARIYRPFQLRTEPTPTSVQSANTVALSEA